ncbi:MAG: phage gp6-like head-tail connector protein [Succinivibrionaceae bacterium]|nr:phage gp6-like head-tail connector protein [Succinivibrionaceae bacterium]
MAVTLEQAKAWCNVEHDEDDKLINSLIVQVQKAAEDFCRRDFSEEMPETVASAILIMVGYLYDHRDNDDRNAYKATHEAFRSLLWPNRDEEAML